MDNPVKKVSALLKAHSIKMLALDWDMTIVSVHTLGKWSGSVRELARKVRPCMRSLLEAVLLDKTIVVTITTFSPQARLIRQALDLALAHSDTSSIHIICSGHDLDLVPTAELHKSFPRIQSEDTKNLIDTGKLPHLHSAISKYPAWVTGMGVSGGSRGRLRPGEIVLIDDDVYNIELAHRCGVVGVHMNISHPLGWVGTLESQLIGSYTPPACMHVPMLIRTMSCPESFKKQSLPQRGLYNTM